MFAWRLFSKWSNQKRNIFVIFCCTTFEKEKNLLCKLVKKLSAYREEEAFKLFRQCSTRIWFAKFHYWRRDTKSFLEFSFVERNKNFFECGIMKLPGKMAKGNWTKWLIYCTKFLFLTKSLPFICTHRNSIIWPVHKYYEYIWRKCHV